MTDLTFTPEQTAAMREQWISSGYSPANFDAAVTPPAAQPAATDPARGEDGRFKVADDIPTVPVFDQAQALEIAESLRAAGVPEDKIQAAMRADGLEPLGPYERDEDEVLFDKALAPALPHEYKLDWYGRIPLGMDADAAAAANGEWQQWCADVGFPIQIGPSVVELAVDRGQWLARADEPTRGLWIEEQKALFIELAGGAEKVPERLEFAKRALARGGMALLDGLTRSGVIHDAGLLIHLANQGERLAWREGKGRRG